MVYHGPCLSYGKELLDIGQDNCGSSFFIPPRILSNISAFSITFFGHAHGGIRVVYYWWQSGRQFWLFTIFDKDEATDLSTQEKKALKQLLSRELEERK
jgi:hypothetical protein